MRFPREKEILKTILDSIEPEKIILFGSRSRGDFSKHSDIDLFVELERPLEFRAKRKLRDTIDKIAGIYSVDLIFDDEVSDEFKRNVEERGIVLWKK